MGLRLVSLAAAICTGFAHAFNASSWKVVAASTAWNRAQRDEPGPGIASGQTGISRGRQSSDGWRFAQRVPRRTVARVKGIRQPQLA
jgi:hypothetical protein